MDSFSGGQQEAKRDEQAEGAEQGAVAASAVLSAAPSVRLDSARRGGTASGREAKPISGSKLPSPARSAIGSAT